MRLIDADEMIKRLQEWNTQDNMDKALYNFALNRIIEQSTAYDVDAVVRQLETRDKPQKVLYRKKSYGTPWLCPACEADQSEVQFVDTGEVTTGGKYSFCWACGQKLDWDVEERRNL